MAKLGSVRYTCKCKQFWGTLRNSFFYRAVVRGSAGDAFKVGLFQNEILMSKIFQNWIEQIVRIFAQKYKKWLNQRNKGT